MGVPREYIWQLATMQLRSVKGTWPRFVEQAEEMARELARGEPPKRQRALRQNVAIELFHYATGRELEDAEVLSRLRRVRRLGYSSLEKRVMMTFIVLQWANANRRHSELALEFLRETRAFLARQPVKQSVKDNMNYALDFNERRLLRKRR